MSAARIYEVVVGLEVHVQLQTKSKLFCGDSIAYGAEPNTQVSPITLAHPGTLPKMNRAAVEMAVKMGLACGCDINRQNYFARKNYFYPDLPKGYQVSQHTTPICVNGKVRITSGDSERDIRLNRIHLEEDAGKSLHDQDPYSTCVDYNRAGTPLIEIVSEPDIRSADEAFSYVSEIRKLVRYLEISDGNMEEGSLRCDANISIRKMGDNLLGTRVEVKNLNSIRNVKRAIEFEAARLQEMAERGETIIQQTRSFDADAGTTFSIRDKEDAEDYRYFADPDLTPFSLSNSFIDEIRSKLPALQAERISQYQTQYNLAKYDASVLTEEKELADYFEMVMHSAAGDSTAELPSIAKATANWLLGPVKSWLNEKGKRIEEFPLAPSRLLRLVELVRQGKVSFSVASGKLFNAFILEPTKNPETIASEQNLLQLSDSTFISTLIDEVLLKLDDKVNEYRKGKKGLLSLFVGEVMKQSKGKADPRLTNDLLLKKLNAGKANK